MEGTQIRRDGMEVSIPYKRVTNEYNIKDVVPTGMVSIPYKRVTNIIIGVKYFVV